MITIEGSTQLAGIENRGQLYRNAYTAALFYFTLQCQNNATAAGHSYHNLLQPVTKGKQSGASLMPSYHNRKPQPRSANLRYN